MNAELYEKIKPYSQILNLWLEADTYSCGNEPLNDLFSLYKEYYGEDVKLTPGCPWCYKHVLTTFALALKDYEKTKTIL